MEWREAERTERRGEWLGRWLRGYAHYAITKG